ncbi:hypothetical protein Ancab_024474, partial [Ancistrocladus abbreviatus]
GVTVSALQGPPEQIGESCVNDENAGYQCYIASARLGVIQNFFELGGPFELAKEPMLHCETAEDLWPQSPLQPSGANGQFGGHIYMHINRLVSCRWVFHFAQLRQLPILVPHLPTENPRLTDTVYENLSLKLRRLLIPLKEVRLNHPFFQYVAVVFFYAILFNPSSWFYADMPGTGRVLYMGLFDYYLANNMSRPMSMALQVGATTSFVSTTGALYLSVGGMLL